MRHFKFDRNLRFSFVLPYGYVSPQAFMLSIPSSDMAYAVYTDDIPMSERITACILNERAKEKAIKSMYELGYIEPKKRCCGKSKWENARYYQLTQAGFYFLTNTPDAEVESDRIGKIPRLKNRNKNELTYTSQDPQSEAARQKLYDIASKPNPNADELRSFEKIFSDSVEYDNLGLLATEPYLAEQVQVNANLRTEAFYRGWKLMNVEALFKANGYLTSIDRRHYQPPHKENENEPINIYDFCSQTLSNWYANHPASFLYTAPLEKYADQVENTWKNTPAFYPISDIDDTLVEIILDSPINEKKTTKSYRHLCIGVAVGKEKNYIVHHTRFGETPWAEIIESNTTGSVQQRLNKANEKNPIFGAKRSISNAIIVCPSTTQFAALFRDTTQANKPESKRKYRIGAPYDAVCIVPVNPSGAMELRGLMESSPIDFERAICSYLLQFEGFTTRPSGGELNDNIFSLSYNKKPVLIGHTMNWQKLAIAKDQYEDGRRFYVSCYPEQVKYIKTIMPDIEFL